MLLELMQEMFTKMVIEKNAGLIPKYYHEEFLLYTNGQEMNYEGFLKSHEEYYESGITYQVDYDDDTLLESGDKVAARVYITTQKENKEPTQIEVMLICQYKDNKIYRLWELTYPDWSQLSEFSE